MKNIFICIVLGLFLISVGVVNAQVDITKSKITRVVDNKKFYVHKVEKGHTLYSLSRAYGVTVKDIAENNVNVMNGLAEGSELLIPQYRA
jgi:LysM repeat protein